jgi:tRNA A-37 threonylcarbamoyl transferase component Bud32
MGKIDLIAVSPIQPSESKAAQRFVLYALLALPAFLAIAFAGARGVSRWKQNQAAKKPPQPTPNPKAQSATKESASFPSGKPASTKRENPAPTPPPPNRTDPPPVPQTPSSPPQQSANPPSETAPARNHDWHDEDDITVLFDPPGNQAAPAESFGDQSPDIPPHEPDSEDKNQTDGPNPASTPHSNNGPGQPLADNASGENTAASPPPKIDNTPEVADNPQKQPASARYRSGQIQEDVAAPDFPPTSKGRVSSPSSPDPLDGQSSHPSDHSGEAVDPDATNVYTPHVARNRSEGQSPWDTNGNNATSHTEDDETRFSMISLEIGDRVDESYDILEIIGKGGAGIVYKVQDSLMDRLFAIKVLSNKKLIKRFINEANVGIDLNHENIVKVYPLRKDKHHGFYYLVMDFIDGCNLKKWFREKPGITFREVLHILEKVCSGLQYAHDKGTWHRDIKPENIMISQIPAEEYPRVLLVDFGLSKLKLKEGEEGEEGDFTRFGGVGTPKYMPPEQHNGRPTFKADIYSVGYVSFLMLSGGELPEEPGMTNINEVRPVVPREVGNVLNVAMNYYPSKRHESIWQFYEELRDAISDSDLDVDSSVTMTDEELNVEDPTE